MSTCFESKKPVQLLLQLTEAKLESIKRYCNRIFSFFVGELEETPYHENRGLKQAMNFTQCNLAGFTKTMWNYRFGSFEKLCNLQE